MMYDSYQKGRGSCQCYSRHATPSPMIPKPKSSYFGPPNTLFENLGSYVKSGYYTSSCIPNSCNNTLSAGSSCGSSLSSYSRCKKVGYPPMVTGYGLSSSDMMFPVNRANCDFNYSKYNPCMSGVVGCDPCKINQDCHPFDDTVIDEPRDLAYIDYQRGYRSFITTNFNQTRDLRGDIPVGVAAGAPIGASQTTHGPYATLHSYRGYVY